MTAGAQTDLLQFYADHFRPGAIDLSSSSPSPAPLPNLARHTLHATDLAYASPEGAPALRAAIAARYQRIGPGDVLVTAGASEALVAVVAALLGPGDTAWASPGVYPSFTHAVRRLGAILVGGETIPAAARCALANNPSIPDGRAIDLPFFIAAATSVGATPVADEVYRELGNPGLLPAAVDLDPRAVSVGDLSKPLGLGGLRIGWIASRDRNLLALFNRQLQLLSGGPSSLSVAAAEAVMASFNEHVDAAMQCVRANTPGVVATLEAHGWEVTLPEAGVTLVARPPVPVTAADLARIEAAGFFLLPTDTLGLPGAFRITLLREPNSLARALEVLEADSPTARTLTRSRRTARAEARIQEFPLPQEEGSGVRPRRSETHARSPLSQNQIPQAGSRALVVLTKAPVAGHAKTRLAAEIGDEAAAMVAQAFLTDTIALAEAGPWRAVVAHSSPATCECVPRMVTTAALVSQPDGNLGDRIHAALSIALKKSCRAVLIGSDTPDLLAALIQRAFVELGDVDVVLGPAADGGFYLIGATAAHASLFDVVPWSTSTVLEAVRENARRLGLSVLCLDPWQDVDDLDSLRSLGSRLATHDRAPATRAALASVTREIDRA